MKTQIENKSLLRRIWQYFRHLPDQSPYWKDQAFAWGIAIVVLIAGGVLFAILALSSVFGGGSIAYRAPGSPGPVVFRHYTHMTFQGGKYKECKTCHEGLFASQKFGTYVIRVLGDSPPKKVHIGRDASMLYVPEVQAADEASLVTYEVPRACATCATGNCHDGKESFSRLECLSCHSRK
ncbi:MAG TPA: hypothetical protein VK463_09715 [Desulfomonilaceae bacterium]|nr:hypothetical protein [Desulfomonilaceae bacterium]